MKNKFLIILSYFFIIFNSNLFSEENDNILKEYKKIKKSQRSNIGQVKKLGLVDKYGKPL